MISIKAFAMKLAWNPKISRNEAMIILMIMALILEMSLLALIFVG